MRATLPKSLAPIALAAIAGAAPARVPAPCAGDSSGDRIVSFVDLNDCLSQYGQSGAALSADFNHDGAVDFTDLNILLSNYGATCWAVGATLPFPTGCIFLRPGAAPGFQFTLQNFMPTLPQTAQYTIAQTSGPDAVVITPGSGAQNLKAGQSLTAAGQVALQTPTSAHDYSEITLTVTGEGGATASAVKQVCVIPTGETSVFLGWDAAYPTLGRWRPVLSPSTVIFYGRTVVERDPGGGGPDTCHFDGSVYGAFIAITGGTWFVNQGNDWGDDYIGWYPAAVTYYRSQGRAPCGTTFLQRMTLNCPGPDPVYETHPISCSMTATTVTSSRASATQTHTWP